MDVNLGGVIILVLGVAFVAILWVRARAFEVLAVEQSESRIEATLRAIDTFDERLSSQSDVRVTRSGSRRRRRGRKTRRRNS
ncbi:MAG: hypothetical protein ACC655_00325 [Rhodothermia bacterium]